MLAKQNDPISKEKKVNTTPINYVELNRLSEDFGKRFVPQQELSDEQAFWLQTSHPNTDQSASSPVKIEAPRELPKVSLVNKSLKKLKYHLGQFDTMVKKRITPDAITEGEWGFEHIKTVFLNEIIPFLKTLKDIFNVFDKDLLNEKELFLKNDQLLQKIMFQDVMICVMNSTVVFDNVNVEMQSTESCVKCLNLDAAHLNKQNEYNDLSKKYFENNNLKAQLQAKDTTICKLKEHIKSMRENDKEEKVKHELDKTETINIELEHSVAKLLSKNERLHKKTGQLNSKSMENADLKRQIQDRVFVITSLKNDLQKLKGKETAKNAALIPIATTITPGMFKIDLEHLAPRLLNNSEAHIDYLKHTQEQADILRGIVEQAKTKQPLDNALDFADEKDENTCNNEKNLSKIQLGHEKEDELVAVVVKVEEDDDFRVDVLCFHTCLTDILGFLEKFGWWFVQDIGGENEDDNDQKLVMVNEEGRMS
ncbi:hypothetical protein Tco_1477087 [Tanacetum coccineum]